MFGTERELNAAGLICRSLAIHAWRQRRAEVTRLRESLANEQHLRLQIVVLKDFLKKENARVGRLEEELQVSRNRAQELAKECERLERV